MTAQRSLAESTVTEKLTLSYKEEISVTVMEEVKFLMRQTDWMRLRRRIEHLKTVQRDFGSAAWAFLGVAISAVLTIIPWVPAYGALTEAGRLDFAWVLPALCGVAISGAVLCTALFILARVMRSATIETADSVCAEMDTIHDVSHLM
jgi:hypothetical protein